jgi:hypothetical protein
MDQSLRTPEQQAWLHKFIAYDFNIEYKSRILIPAQQGIRHKIMVEFHSSPIGGHARITRTLARISAQFY